MSKGTKKSLIFLVGLVGLLIGAGLAVTLGAALSKTGSNEYCMSCHYHDEADGMWKRSEHCNSGSGVTTDCTACHLPPREDGYFAYWAAKMRIGVKDLWMKMTHKPDEIDWEAKRTVEHASIIVYNSSCEKCHTNLFPSGISDEGITAHLYYNENSRKLNLQCVSCHLDTGHEMPGYTHKSLTGKVSDPLDSGIKYTEAATVTSFENFTETVPGTGAAISMVAVPGGEFLLGSPENEPFRGKDEGPQKRVRISPFFIGETEVTWSQYWAFYNETMSEGRTPPAAVYANNSRPDVDAVSGPTPPFGFPDQGWGMGERPAITMTHYAAETFCQWLSLKTGRHYRLPTEAEWEYAARGGTQGAYFFEGNPKKYSGKSFRSRLLGADTTMISRYIVYEGDSAGKTAEPSTVKANPWGLKNMLGNVMEYCSDYYAEDAYSKISDGQTDPHGPQSGAEFVVRGGAYCDDAALVRCAARSHTLHDEWLRTDPQSPKSIWWYSDIKGIGFRVVCDVPEGLK